MRAIGVARISPSRLSPPPGRFSAHSRSAAESGTTTEKVCTSPTISEAMKQPSSEPRPPNTTTTTTKTIGPIESAMPDSVVK